MNSNSSALGLIVQATLKLDPRTPEWRNVVAFIQSCYACRVREYDLDAALASLCKLTDPEQNALIAWVLLIEEVRSETRRQA